MSFNRKIILIMVALSLFALTCGCKKEGPAERAGEKIDKAVEKVKKKLDDATK